jgi:GntR family transcriptional regulator / MocR family aminotransferase
MGASLLHSAISGTFARCGLRPGTDRRLLRAVAHHFGARAAIIGQGAGLHVVLQLSINAPGETEIIYRALKKGIRLFPFTATHAAGEPVSTMLLIGFGGMTAGKIESGIALLSQVCL